MRAMSEMTPDERLMAAAIILRDAVEELLKADAATAAIGRAA